MYYLIPLPLMFIATIVRAISKRYKLKIFEKVSTILMVLFALWFIYEYAKYRGFDIIAYILGFFKI